MHSGKTTISARTLLVCTLVMLGLIGVVVYKFILGTPPGFISHATEPAYDHCAICGEKFAGNQIPPLPRGRHYIWVDANANQNPAEQPFAQYGIGVYCEGCANFKHADVLYKAVVDRVSQEINLERGAYFFDDFFDQENQVLRACRKELYGNDSITASPFQFARPTGSVGVGNPGEPLRFNPVPIMRPKQNFGIRFLGRQPATKPAEVPQKIWDKKIGEQTSLEPQPKPTVPDIDLSQPSKPKPPPPVDTYEQEVKVRQDQHEWQQRSYKEFQEEQKTKAKVSDTHKSIEDGTPAPDFAKLQHDYDLREADKAAMAAWDNQPVHDFRGPDAPWLRKQTTQQQKK